MSLIARPGQGVYGDSDTPLQTPRKKWYKSTAVALFCVALVVAAGTAIGLAPSRSTDGNQDSGTGTEVPITEEPTDPSQPTPPPVTNPVTSPTTPPSALPTTPPTTSPPLGQTLCQVNENTKEVTLTATQVITETFDGECTRYIAGAELGDGSQSESQKAMFRLQNGATLKNVILGSPAADGVHTYGDVTIDNIIWEDIGEDALTIKNPGTVRLNNGRAYDGSDKVFQINAESKFYVSNFEAHNAGKFIRQNGGTTFKIEVYVEDCIITGMKEAIFRTDSTESTISMKNVGYKDVGTKYMGANQGAFDPNNLVEENVYTVP